MTIDLDDVAVQENFGRLVGVSQPRVAQLVADGILWQGGTYGEWLAAYCARLREQAAGRSSDGPLDLSQERAALAREQRMGIEIKNAVLRGEYASIELLAEVLASASQAVSERFDHLPGMLKKACPDLPSAAIDQVMATIAGARNEWVRSTAELVSSAVIEDDPADVGELFDEPRHD